MRRRVFHTEGRALRAFGLCLGLLVGSAVQAASEPDPWEGFNRSVFNFNDAVDQAALKPLAEGYKRWVPELVRTGVDNFLGNIGDAWSTVNHVLQGKGVEATTMGFRVVTNTFFGLGGLLDPASEMGMERQSEDFGQTLGRWGMPSGPYLVLPLLGPSTARDGAARVVDSLAGPTALVHGTPDTVGVLTLQIVSTRAGLLGASQMLDEIALDKYQFLRDAYLARRRNQVYDGNPPEEPEAE
ncbi:MlaA family lipoprotein [Ideonella livida]|uniref:VacJ family lipoprotein n=1 Tax=Ideonella livida TaxID=2707176 RepID=A0A7C9TNB8_9BURK|nr:VacJ family lipoprotein [Ideonella livida]NDY92366.1 VacJ family lipoprotein [Ideonella livida]